MAFRIFSQEAGWVLGTVKSLPLRGSKSVFQIRKPGPKRAGIFVGDSQIL